MPARNDSLNTLHRGRSNMGRSIRRVLCLILIGVLGPLPVGCEFAFQSTPTPTSSFSVPIIVPSTPAIAVPSILTPSATPTIALERIGLIVFHAFRTDGAFKNDTPDIYVMLADGTGLVNLTNHQARNVYPAWSPDSKQIAFLRDQNLFVMDADGSHLKQLTQNMELLHPPSWSPDGKWIAVSGQTKGEENGDIWVVNVTDLKLTNLTHHPAQDLAPVWSPDGIKIAFDSNRDGNYQVYIMDANGKDIRQLTRGSYVNFRPRWSPNGTNLVYSCDTPGATLICIMNPDGQLLNLQNRQVGYEPVWSPDGSRILYRSGDFFRVMNADGSNATSVLDFVASGFSAASDPSWQSQFTK